MPLKAKILLRLKKLPNETLMKQVRLLDAEKKEFVSPDE